MVKNERSLLEVLDNTTLKYLADYVETDDKLNGYMFYI